jgi:hypothetical protein
VALEKLSATPKVPPREEEGRANSHNTNNVIQGDGGLVLPPLALGKGEDQTIKTAFSTELAESSNTRGYSSYHQPHHEPREFKLPKIDFPKFEGEHTQLWKQKCEKYFSMYNVPVHVWSPFATINFRGNAELWFQSYEAQHTVGTWPELLKDRYGEPERGE